MYFNSAVAEDFARFAPNLSTYVHSTPLVGIYNMSFNDKVISLWVVTFDSEHDRTYVYVNSRKVIACVESLILDESGSEEMAAEFREFLIANIDKAVLIPIEAGDSRALIRRIELDKYNPVVACLMECHNKVRSQKLKKMIEALFV